MNIGLCIFGSICNFIGSMVCVFLLWGIYFRPYAVRPHVDDASLASFNLLHLPNPTSNTTQSALVYDVTLNVTFFNDHRIFAIRFNHLTAGLYYSGTKLGPSDDSLPKFKLHTRRHRTVQPVLHGQASNVDTAMVVTFAREREQGQFNIVVRVKTTLTYKWWPDKETYYYEYDCWMQFTPPPGNGTPAVSSGVLCGKRK